MLTPWLDYDFFPDWLIFLNMAQGKFALSWHFQEMHGCILITFRTDKFLVTVCGFICLAQLGLNSMEQIRGFRASKILHGKYGPKSDMDGVVSWPFSELIWSRYVYAPHCGATLTKWDGTSLGFTHTFWKTRGRSGLKVIMLVNLYHLHKLTWFLL